MTTTTTIIIAVTTEMTLFVLLLNIEGMMHCEYTPPCFKKRTTASNFILCSWLLPHHNTAPALQHFTLLNDHQAVLLDDR